MAEYGEKAALAAMRGCVKRNQTVLASDAEIVLAMIDRQQALQDVAERRWLGIDMDHENTKEFVRRVLLNLGNNPTEETIEAVAAKIEKRFSFLRATG